MTNQNANQGKPTMNLIKVYATKPAKNSRVSQFLTSGGQRGVRGGTIIDLNGKMAAIEWDDGEVTIEKVA